MKTLEQRVAEAESAARAARAGENQAMRGERKARALWRSAADRAGSWERKAGKIIEQAGAWKRRALAAENDLKLAREQARYREAELTRSGHQQLLEAQANALEAILQIAKQLPEPIIEAAIVEPKISVEKYFDEDNVSVVEIDTSDHPAPLRVKLNNIMLWGSNSSYKTPQQDANATISRQLDTIREQAEKLDARQESIEALQAERDELQNQYDSNLASFRSLKTRKRELQDELDESRRAFSAIDSRNRELAEETYALKTKIEQLETERAEAGETISTLNARIIHVRRDLDAARTDRDARKAEHAESVAGFNDQLAAFAASNTAREELESIRLNKARTLLSFYRAKSDAERSLLGQSFTTALHELLAEFPELREELDALPAVSKYLSMKGLLPRESLVAQHSALAHAAMKLARAVLGEPANEHQRKLARAIHDNETHQLMLLPQDQDQITELELAALTESVRKVLTKEPALLGSSLPFKKALRELRATYEAQMGADPEPTNCT